MANGQRFFHLSQLQQHFCHENYLVLARTQLFHQLPLLKCPCIRGSHILHDCFGHFACVKCFANEIYNGFKVFIRATIHENWISWKFNPQNISPMKISASTVCTDRLHNTTSTLHLTHTISIHSDKLCILFCKSRAQNNFLRLPVSMTGHNRKWQIQRFACRPSQKKDFKPLF